MNNFWKAKKVVVTGAAGFIGSHAVCKLVEQGAVVKAVVSSKTHSKTLKNKFGSIRGRITIVTANLLQSKDCLKITKNQDIVLNFAAIDGGSRFKIEHSAEILSSNMRIVLNMLDASVANNVDRFLLMSSVEAYPKNAKVPITENTVWSLSEKTNGYVWAKRLTEIAAKMYADEFGLKVAIARPGNVYGPGDFTGVKKERVIPVFIQKVLKHEKIDLFNDGKQKKQFIYIDDLVSALLDLTEKYAVCDPVNIAGQETISIKDLANAISFLIHLPSKNFKITTKKSERQIDIAKAEKVIHFQPQVNLYEGLRQTVVFYQKK